MTNYLVSDLDHTLLNERGALSPVTQAAVAAVADRVMLASARHPGQMTALIDQLGLTGPQAALNGALIFAGASGETLKAQSIDDRDAQAVVELVAERFGEVNFTWMDAAAWHVSFVDAAVEFDQRLVPVPLAMDGLKPAGALMLLMIVSDPGMFQTLGQLLKSAFPKLTISPAGDGYLTITAPGVDKGRAVDYLVSTGISRAKVVAVGDDENDLPLLNRAGHAAAVGNAASVVKQRAQVLLPTNEEDGVATLIKSWSSI